MCFKRRSRIKFLIFKLIRHHIKIPLSLCNVSHIVPWKHTFCPTFGFVRIWSPYFSSRKKQHCVILFMLEGTTSGSVSHRCGSSGRPSVVECKGSRSSSSWQWGETVTLWILQSPPAPSLCRQLMFICAAHMGLVTKHLVKLPVCMRCITEWWQWRSVAANPFPKRSQEAGRTSS